MYKSLFRNYSSVYIGDPRRDTAVLLTEDGEIPVPEAQSYFREHLLADVLPGYLHPVESLCSALQDEHALSSRDHWEAEYLCGTEDAHVWMRLSVRIIERNDDGTASRYLLTTENINESKLEQIEEERVKAEHEILVNQAFENSNILKFTLYVNEHYGLASQGIEDLHGAPRRMDNMPDAFRDNFVKPEYHALHDEMYARCFAGINHASCELVDVNGHWTRVTLEIVQKDPEGKPTIVLGIVENTDELHAARTEMEIMEQVCEFAVNSHYEDANLIDAQTGTVRSLLQHPFAPDVGFHFAHEADYEESLAHTISAHAASDEDADRLATLHLDSLIPLLREKGNYSIRCRMRTDFGQISWKLVECAFFKDNEDRIIMLTTDVQEEEDIKDQLREAALEAQEANHAKSAFLANMSHEIRTPMNAIVGISEILLGKDLPEDVLMDIGTIQNSGSSLLGIINDILDFSKIETGKFEISEVEYMLPSVLMDISNVISVRLSGRPVYFMMDIDPRLPNHFIGDDIRLKQILLNLIGNSVKFTHEGFIELRGTGTFINETDYKLTFEVRDSGIGIRHEDFGKLFQTFSQVDTRKNRAVTGSGLGLSISKNLAEMMGGTLTVESEYGKGSVFTVTVIQKVHYYEPIGDVHNKKDIHVLICEQNETIIHSLCRTLEKLSLDYEICREPNRIRSFQGMTHVLIRRKAFGNMREKLEFMFPTQNIFLILENDEHAEGHYMKYKQLQLPLICMQLINALNGEEIVTSIKKKSFDRSQIIPLTFARILLVDDNTTNLQVAQGLMAPYKMKIDVATSGFKAIELVKAIRYDAIFMDHMMPEMDGIETTKYIRSLEGDYYKAVPIIALTANAMSGAKAMFLEAGMDDFVAKPIEMTELNRVLKHFVQSKAPEGYIKNIQEQAHHDPEGNTSALHSGTAPGGAFSMPAFTTVPGQGQQDLWSQLLAQNGNLLSQNMLLLQQLFSIQINDQGGTPAETAVPASAPGSAAAPAYGNAAVHTASQTEPETLKDPDMQELRDYIPGVDMQGSLEIYGGSVRIYHDILRTYNLDIKNREPVLQELYDKRNLHDFTIYVHAIKSASRGAGANELGEMAYQLETAGKNQDWDTIDKIFPDFMNDLHNMVINVGKYARKYLFEEKIAATGDSFDHFDPEMIARIRGACEDMDYLAAENLLHQMSKQHYTQELEEVLQEMIEACSAFDYEKLEDMLKTLS